MQHALEGAAFAEFGQVEPGAEVLALAAHNDRARLRRQVDECRVELRHERVVDRVALARAHQPEVQQGVAEADAKQVEFG